MKKQSRLDGTPPLLDHVHIDYIRLATFDFEAYCSLAAVIRQKHTGWRKANWLQYKMERSQDNVAFGIGEQSKRPHGVLEATGSDAHVFCHWLLETQQESLDSLYATRIDLCLTKRAPDSLDYAKTYKRIAKPKGLHLGDDGNTLYVGNRESDSFWRLYDKTHKHVRLEVELKGNQAKRYWRAIVTGASPAALFTTKLQSSRVPKFIVDYYATGQDALNMDDFPVADMTDMLSKARWLATLDGLVYKLCKDHDAGPMASATIARWADYANLP